MELPSQNIYSKNPDTNGFDLSTGNTWIYPKNFPIRDYQYNIVKTALYYNTLVCLPTGLGKTFIAAVVMYNFWRWYPFGKIVFLAPTKPLVAQQINACYEVMGIPSIDMIELTGSVNHKNREMAWSKKRIIFATPQIFYNDLKNEKLSNLSHLVKCVVIDEAHKALGKHSYCECIRILSMQNQYFRILALSATPGNKLDNVYKVIQNLQISHLELRDENSIDIMPYINRRKVDIILVPLSNELATFKDKYIIIMDRYVKILTQNNVLRGFTANISKGRIFYLLEEFKKKKEKSENYSQIMKTLNILLTMYHAYELMIRHGLRAFYKFYQTHSDKFWMQNEEQLQKLLCDIKIFLGPFPDSNEYISEIPTNLVFGHNKFYKLKELLEHHFGTNNGDQKDTRAIVFVEYRDIVNEVYILLLQSKPIIRPQMFVGQAGQKQKQQIKALEDFRSNHVNVLISTSIGEEGLDVGEVDLIVCFDVSQHSPIRLVQRMGRTGRKRDGHIIVLVTDGKEHENLKSTLSKRDSLNNKILNTSNIFSSLYQNNPRMIPNQFAPKCYEREITVLPKILDTKNRRKKKSSHLGVDKKPKKGVDKKSEIASIQQKNNSSKTVQKNSNQLWMTKFLTNSKYNEQKQDNTYNILTALITQNNNNTHNAIDPSNVKLLSDDDAGIDFLTLCALKKSEEEMSSETVYKMATTYIPTRKPVGDLFNFVVPDTKILDCLSFLTTDLKNTLLTQDADSKHENIHENNDYDNIDDENSYIFRDKVNNENNEIRFEDILDESSDSEEAILHSLNQDIPDISDIPDVWVEPINKVSPSHIRNDNEVTTANLETKLSINNFEDMETSIFENILNDSFNSEDDLEHEDATRNTIPENSSNNFNRNTKKMSIASEDAVNASCDKNNVDISNQDLLRSSKFVKLNRINEYADCFTDEIQDFDYNSNDDLSEFVCNKNKSVNNTKAEESMLSITQAVCETMRMKKDLEKSRSVHKEETTNEDDTGWISVDITNKTNDEKKKTNSVAETKLSHINHESTAQSYTTKQDLDFPDDSDEEFMTEDNMKKVAEIESRYFRNTSEDFEDFRHDACNNSKPQDASTSNKLSLKRNRNEYSKTINFNTLRAPKRCVNNREDKNILEPSVSNPRQMSSFDKNILQKSNRRYKHRKRIKNEFINDEADISYCDASSDESIDTTDEDLSDFVSHTQNIEDRVDMQGHYLQTVNSPIKRPGAFHFKKLKSPDLNTNIYSQPLSRSELEDTYVNDSFCVTENVEPSILVKDDSILEKAEKKLKRRQQKRLRSDKDDGKRNGKRKRIIVNTSESSDDEIEKLRLQVKGDCSIINE